MNTLWLRFTGLCGFVPNHQTMATRARVLLVDALSGHAPHYPVLVFFRETWDSESGGREPDGYFTDDAGSEMGFCRLDDQDLWILDAEDKKLKICGQTEERLCPSGQTEELLCPPDSFRRFGWVAPMHKINRPHDAPSSHYWGKVKDQCMASQKVDRSVIGRVSLTEGQLTSYTHAVDDEELVVKWRFQIDPFDDPTDHIQSLTEEVQLEYQYERRLAFAGRKGIRGDAPYDLSPLYLKPIVGTRVQAWVENMPWDQITGRTYDEGRLIAKRLALRTRRGRRNPDYHFRHFYDFLSGPKSNRIPFPEDDRCDNDGQPSVDNPKCPPVQLSAREDA